MKKLFMGSLAFTLIDFVIKQIIINNLALDDIFELTSFLYITYVKNIGAAFSMLKGNVFFLIIISFIALNILFHFYNKENKISKIKYVSYCLLIGGIIGNLIDRIFYNSVIDYIGVIIFKYHFPIFNFADICIVIGCILLFILSLKEDKNDGIQN